jgi:glyoxylase-like metal-dependent hydrolase (beta-lactamase superfamily II)
MAIRFSSVIGEPAYGVGLPAPMEIHALSTGTVRVKHSFLHARKGPRRQLSLFMPGPFSDPLPIHLWVVEHEGRRLLVDTGETAAVNDIPFARFAVDPGEELPAALATIGLTPGDVDTVVLTHLHGDHMDGAVHLGDQPVLVSDIELAYSRSAISRVFQRVLRQPVPEGMNLEPMTLDAGPFGAFAASTPLSPDGRVVAVATPGHTPGHISVVCIDDDGHHVLLAGDATDTLEQLRARRPDAVGPKPAVSVETIDRILEHGTLHPTVFLPSHDPDSADRLATRDTI